MANKNMFALKEMVWLIDRYKLRNIEVLGHSEESDSNYAIFYDKISDGTFQTDEDAAQFFFGKGGKDANYQRFRRKFQRRLTNSIFFIDVKKPEFNNAQVAYYNCWKGLSALKYLIGRGARHAAVSIGKKILTASIKFDFTVIVIETATFLRSHQASYTGDRKSWNYYNKIVKEYTEMRQAEIRAAELREEISIDFVNSKSPKKYKSEQARGFMQELTPYLEKFPNSYWLHLSARLIKIYERMVVYDYLGTAEVCRKAIAFFEAKPYETKAPVALFSHQLIVCLIMMKAFDEADEVAIKVQKLVPNGSMNWFRGREQYLVLQFHRRDYQKAYKVFREVTSHQKFDALPSSEKELWRIYEAWFYLLLETGKLSKEGLHPKPKRFKFKKFLNEVPVFSKDKRGMNVPILLLQVIMLIYLKEYDKTEDRLHALEKYASRHLDEEDTSFRTSCLVRMLRFMPKCGYVVQKLKGKTKQLLEKMSAAPIMLADQLHEIEALPYEVYWSYLLEMLPAKRTTAS